MLGGKFSQQYNQEPSVKIPLRVFQAVIDVCFSSILSSSVMGGGQNFLTCLTPSLMHHVHYVSLSYDTSKKKNLRFKALKSKVGSPHTLPW